MRTTIIIPSYTPVFFLYIPLLPLSVLMFPRVTKSPERYVWHPNVYKAALPEGRKKIIQDEIFEKKIKHFFSGYYRKTECLNRQTICITLNSFIQRCSRVYSFE